MSDQKALTAYVKQSLKIQARPHEPVAVTVESIVEVADRLRLGCHRDVLRLITNCIKDLPPNTSGEEALRALGAAIEDQGTEGWGLP